MPNTPGPIPQHVAIIMDGNGRWAKQRGFPRIEGHRRGVETVRTMIDATKALGVRYLTLYAFSVENWKRPPAEVGALMGLLEYFLKREISALVRDKIRLRTIGRTQELPEAVRRQLDSAVAATAHFTDYTLVLALNYGSRTEVVDAARAYAAALAAGTIKADDTSWESFARHLNSVDLPDPDLVIRTSGEYRVSNFLFCDGSVRFVGENMDYPTYKHIGIKDDGEVVSF